MDAIWVTCNTTSLNPSAANIVDVAWCFQLGGTFTEVRSVKVRPLFFSEDCVWGKYSPEKVVKAINQESSDPRKTHVLYSDNSFMYSPQVLSFLDLNPGDLLGDNCLTPQQFVASFREDLGEKKWRVVGYGVKFFAEVLDSFVKRVGADDFSDTLLTQEHQLLDILHSAKLLSLFRPDLRDVSYRSLADAFDLPKAYDAVSRLKGLQEFTQRLFSGAVSWNNPLL